MHKKTQNKLNSFIKNKIMNETHKYQSFIYNNNHGDNEIISVFIIDNQFWASVFIENFYEEKFKKTNKKSFIPFILYPINLNSVIEKKNMDGDISYNKYNSISTDYLIENDLFFFKNIIIPFENDEDEEPINMINLDKVFRKPIYVLSNNDKKALISEAKKIKKIDIYNQFSLNTLKKLIEKKIEEYLLKTDNYFTFSFFDNEIEDFQELNIRHLKKKINYLPITFKATEEKINLIINEKKGKRI